MPKTRSAKTESERQQIQSNAGAAETPGNLTIKVYHCRHHAYIARPHPDDDWKALFSHLPPGAPALPHARVIEGCPRPVRGRAVRATGLRAPPQVIGGGRPGRSGRPVGGHPFSARSGPRHARPGGPAQGTHACPSSACVSAGPLGRRQVADARLASSQCSPTATPPASPSEAQLHAHSLPEPQTPHRQGSRRP